MVTENKPLVFSLIKACNTTKARVSKMILPHGEVDTPVFMPVGTQVIKVTLFDHFFILRFLGHFKGNASRTT